MKWLFKNKTPSDGDARVRDVFAWRRTRVGDHIVWLESYRVHERYVVAQYNGPGRWVEGGRTVVYWNYLD